MQSSAEEKSRGQEPNRSGNLWVAQTSLTDRTLRLCALGALLAAGACSVAGLDGNKEGGDGDGDSANPLLPGDGDFTPGDGDVGPGDGDVGPGDGDDGGGGGIPIGETGIVPLFSAGNDMERPVLEDTGDALITRFGDRGRDRHAREDNFAAYDHYLSHYWEHRTISAEIIDTIGREPGGGSITFNVVSEFKLEENQAELRFFYRGIGTVAEYHNNGVMAPVIDDFHYTRSVDHNPVEGRHIEVGDHMEFELSQFLDKAVEAFGGRANYYGTTYLYVAGQGLVPWKKFADGPAQDNCGGNPGACEEEYSLPISEEGWLGGLTTLPYQYSAEPRDHFMQMANNLAGDNAQPFVLGRRIVHTDFLDGVHSENNYEGGVIIDNPDYTEQIGKLGPLYINESCDACHVQNTRSLPPAPGNVLEQFVFKVGDETGAPHPNLGAVFQPGNDLGVSEGNVTLASWTEENGLRRPNYTFSGTQPAQYSARMAPQLVGMGLLEAIPETAILALADPDDTDQDGVSGRYRTVIDPVTGDKRLGRFGWKAGQASVRNQVAGALNTDMGVMTTVFPEPDCGSAQGTCGEGGAELGDSDLHNLVTYISLLGVRARRALDSAQALEGETLFSEIGCADCHQTTFETSAYSLHAEVRDQTIHPYTDLLLHDMGPGLADNLAEGDASGAEWRTPPLWNIGLTADVNSGEAYLHDGRARTLDEAIRWHGGEGQSSNDAYQALSEGEKAALIAFLKSL